MDPAVVIVHRVDEYVWEEVYFENNRTDYNHRGHHDKEVPEVDTTTLKWTALYWRAYAYTITYIAT